MPQRVHSVHIKYTIYIIKPYDFSFTQAFLLHGTANLFTNTQQNPAFVSVGSRLSGISGSKRGARCLNSFVDCLDSPFVYPKFRIYEVRKNEGRVYLFQVSTQLR